MTETNTPRSRRKVYVVLPVYNEEAKIGSLLDHIDDAMRDAAIRYEVLLVDDGSKDGTDAIIRQRATTMPLTLMRHDVNQGLRATIRDGLFRADQAAGGEGIHIHH